jgi:hypothetical protein
MNRIVIVGNGFDIAMGCKTGTEDFLLWMFKRELQKMFERSDFQSSIFKSMKENKVFSNRFLNDEMNMCEELFSLLEILKRLEIKGTNQFISNLIFYAKDRKWFSLEQIYFRELKNAIQPLSGKKPSDNVSQLNEMMTIITKELEVYLSRIQNKHEYKLSHDQRKFFNQFFQNRKDLDVPVKFEGEVLFLNFNYTNILENCLFRASQNSEFSLIHIHGKVENKDGNNPILVGYGNDLSEEFKDIEKFNELDLTMQFVKPFHYSRNRSFTDLLNFMDLGDFEVFIVGHSCAMTDHTLFRHLLESSNCNKVKLFHRGNYDDFFKRNAQIGRHFMDKMKRVKLIMEYDKNDFIPLA